MSSDVAIKVAGVSKSFPVYSKPIHRMFQMFSRKESKHRWFREFKALDCVDLTIRRGETVGIVGRNGSGKSTLLQIICGTLSPTSGSVEVFGRVAALLELGAGFNPEFTGRENVFLYGTVLGLSRADVESRLAAIIEFADIGDFLDQPVKSYSSGMFVRLAFAVAINVDPDILVVDEALSVGDEAFQRKCFARIEALRRNGATILFVSHSAGSVVDLCDRAILLDQGQLLLTGAPKMVVSKYQRLLYAPPDRAVAVRAQIREHDLNDAGGGAVAAPSPATVASASPKLAVESSIGDASGLVAFYDEGLVVPVAVAYESLGASISEPRIENLAGEKVNVLVPGETYSYCYRVDFERSIAGVRCGMMIRTVTGAELGGAATALAQDALPLVEAGQRLDVRFSFDCLLAPGAYFLNAGVLGRVSDAEVFLDRRIDVLMFKVLPAPGRLATGFVDLNFIPELSFT